MGIPVYISKVQRTQELPPQQMPCTSCRMVTVHHVLRLYETAHVYLLPMFSGAAEHHYTCTSCGVMLRGPAPVGAPARPFLHQFGCLVFVVLPVTAIIAYVGIDRWLDRRRAEASAAEEKAREQQRAEQGIREQDAVAAAKDAKEALDEAKRRCFMPIDAARVALPKGVIEMAAQKPANPSRLVGAAPVVIKGPGGVQLPTPKGKYFGEQACSMDVPKHVADTVRFGALPEGVSQESVLAGAKALKEQAKALTTPPFIVLTDHACVTVQSKCEGAAAWVEVSTKKVLAVARVAGPSDQGLDGLATLLGKEPDRW